MLLVYVLARLSVGRIAPPCLRYDETARQDRQKRTFLGECQVTPLFSNLQLVELADSTYTLCILLSSRVAMASQSFHKGHMSPYAAPHPWVSRWPLVVSRVVLKAYR